jgi:uncharacterized protein (TIGR03382 family)
MVGRDNEGYVRSWLQSVRVVINLFADDEDDEIAQARLAMSLAEGVGNPTNPARASFALGWALRHRYPEEAIAALDRAVALGRRGAGTTSPPSALCVAAMLAALARRRRRCPTPAQGRARGIHSSRELTADYDRP